MYACKYAFMKSSGAIRNITTRKVTFKCLCLSVVLEILCRWTVDTVIQYRCSSVPLKGIWLEEFSKERTYTVTIQEQNRISFLNKKGSCISVVKVLNYWLEAWEVSSYSLLWVPYSGWASHFIQICDTRSLISLRMNDIKTPILLLPVQFFKRAIH